MSGEGHDLKLPATMELLGKWNWYLPSWLSWLPDLRVEAASTPKPPRAAEPGIAGGGGD